MPWDHCGRSLDDTEQACPGCGIQKSAWTVQWNVTRSLRVTRSQGLRFALLDTTGQPVAGEPFTVTCGEEPAIEGRTDELGAARVATAGPGPARVAFPGRAPGDVWRFADPETAGGLRVRSDARAETEPPGPAPGDEEPATLSLAIGPRHDLRLDARPGVVHARVHERGEGLPVASRPYRLLTGVAVLEGTTGADGLVRHEGVPRGYHRLLVDGLTGLVDSVAPDVATRASEVWVGGHATPDDLDAAGEDA